MKSVLPLLFSILLTALLPAQQLVPEASDDHGTWSPGSSSTTRGPDGAAAWYPAGTTFYNRTRADGGWIFDHHFSNFYVFGGEIAASQWGVTRTNVVECFNAVFQTWSIHPAVMPVPVSNISGSCVTVGFSSNEMTSRFSIPQRAAGSPTRASET